MPALPSSNASRTSSRELLLAALALSLISAAATFYAWSHDYLLYYGDAAAHLNNARKIIDNRTPGVEQLGTVWLPLPQLLMLPFALHDPWWKSGLAGAFPSGLAFVLGGLWLYRCLRYLFRTGVAATAGLAVLALNPNLLYLQALPMTEAIFFAAVTAILWYSLHLWETDSWLTLAALAVAVNAAALTRYEGWFLIPFVCARVWWCTGFRRAAVFGLLCGVAPVWWLAHNWWFYGDALEFYRGPWSAKAIYERTLRTTGFRAPGDGDWILAGRIFIEATRVVCGHWLTWIGIVGALASFVKGRWWAVTFLALSPIFYVWSLHSSGNPIYVPTLAPFTLYNTRYALSALPLLAVGVAAIASRVPHHAIVFVAVLLVAGQHYWRWTPDSVICFRESRINSEARRPWVRATATMLRAHYRPGLGIMSSAGDTLTAYAQAGIPLREVLFDANHPMYDVSIPFPRTFVRESYVLGVEGDEVEQAARRAQYGVVDVAHRPGSPPVFLFKVQ